MAGPHITLLVRLERFLMISKVAQAEEADGRQHHLDRSRFRDMVTCRVFNL
jgi:hypothetical protein